MTTTRTTQPTTLGLAPSFGFGDRLGLATPGHLQALRDHGGDLAGIFAQQSIREMNRTGRTPGQVMEAAVRTLDAAGYDKPWGADADHLKTFEDIRSTAEAGFVFFTIDPSDHVDQAADDYAQGALEDAFSTVASEIPWVERYRGRTEKLDTGTEITFSEQVVRRAAVKYGRAIAHTVELAGEIERVCESLNQPFEIELSVDETAQPTTLAEHFIIADQCREQGVKSLKSLAPRYIGEFEKGVDYKGDLDALERSLRDHAAIASRFGPYKLSLHSGSDKLCGWSAATTTRCSARSSRFAGSGLPRTRRRTTFRRSWNTNRRRKR